MIQISCKVSLNWIGWFPSCHKFACLLWLKVQELSNLIVPSINIWIVIFQINNYFLSPVMLSRLAEQSTTLSLVVWNVQLKCIFNMLCDGRITFNINVSVKFNSGIMVFYLNLQRKRTCYFAWFVYIMWASTFEDSTFILVHQTEERIMQVM